MFFNILLCMTTVCLLTKQVCSASITTETFAKELAKQSIAQFTECGYNLAENVEDFETQISNAKIEVADIRKYEIGAVYIIYFTLNDGHSASFFNFNVIFCYQKS